MQKTEFHYLKTKLYLYVCKYNTKSFLYLKIKKNEFYRLEVFFTFSYLL